MKCVKSVSGEIKRVTDSHAEKLVKKGWSYIPKKEWKDTARKIAVAPETVVLVDTPVTEEAPKTKKIPGKKHRQEDKKRSQM